MATISELEPWVDRIRALARTYRHRKWSRLWFFWWEPGFPMEDVVSGVEPGNGDLIVFDEGIPGDARLAPPALLRAAGIERGARSAGDEFDSPLGVLRTLRRCRIRRDVWMFDWTPGFPMDGVLVTEEDRKAGSPKEGDRIAFDALHPRDRLFLVSRETFERYYEAEVI